MAGRRTRIHNLSNEPISLIPFVRQNTENLDLTFMVSHDLAQTINVGNPITVNLENLDLRDNHSQIYILFRAGNYGESVQRAEGEELFTHATLSTRGYWFLGLNERGQVSRVENLREEINALHNRINALQQRMAALEARLPNN